MNNIDKSKYPQMPESFHNRIEKTFDIMDKEVVHATLLQRNLRVILVAAVIIVVLTVSVFAGGKVYNSWIDQKNYQVTLVPEQKVVTKEFVDVKLNYLPQGFSKYLNNFYYKDNELNKGLHLSLYRLDEYDKIEIKYSVGYEEKTFGQHKGAIISKPDDYQMDRQVIIYFEDDGYVLSMNVCKEISNEELIKVAEGIELVETDEENAFYCEHRIEIPSTQYPQEPIKSEFNKNEVLHVGDKITGLIACDVKHIKKNKESLDLTIDSVEFYDNIKKFDKNGFNHLFLEDKDPFADENGNLLSYERKKIKYGDGVNSINEVESVKTVNNKFMCVTVTLKNTSSIDREFYVNQVIPVLFTEANGVLIENTNDLCSGNYYNVNMYASPNDSEKFSYYKKVKAGQSITLTLGYFVDDDRIDDIYLSVEQDEGKTRKIISIH